MAFNHQDEKSLRRGELIGDISGKEFRRIIDFFFLSNIIKKR